MKNTNHKDAVLALTLLLLLLQWRWPQQYGLPIIATFILLSLLFKSFAAVCHKVWMGLAKFLNAISTTLLLTVVYLLLVLPTALFSRLFKKSAIKFKPFNNQSNFIVVDKLYSNEDFLQSW